MNKPKKHSSTIIKNALNRISPLEKKKVESKMMFSIRILELMKECGLNKTQFAQKVGKKNSEITKWLSGTHNFTLDIMIEIASALDVELQQLLDEGKTQNTLSVWTSSVCINLDPPRFISPFEMAISENKITPLSIPIQQKSSQFLHN